MSKSKQQPVQPQGTDATQSEHPEGALADEDFVYVPRGKSRGAYIFILALMVFTLIMFVVPYGLQSLVEPRGPSQAFMTWQHPRLGAQEVSYKDFKNHQRTLAEFYQFFPADSDVYNEQNTAAFLVTEALAEEAGVQFGDADLAKFLIRAFGSAETYGQAVAGRRTTPAKYEAAAKRVQRVERYKGMVLGALVTASPEEIESAWNERHEQFAFEAIGLDVEPLLATASSEATDEAALQAWYEARPPRAGAFADDWRDALASAEVVGWSVDSADDPAALLAKYPLDEATDLAGLARQYYDENFYTRFLLDEPATDAEGRPQLYSPFEDVEAIATREAPIHRALNLWRGDLGQRLADGEAIDLGAEAAALGLIFEPAGELRQPRAWDENDEEGENAPFVGRFVADGIRRAEDSGMCPRVIVETDALVVTRVIDKVEAGPSPYADVKDKVAEEWAKERAGEIALERLQEAYDSLAVGLAEGERPNVDLVSFEAQASGMGTEVVRQDWFDPLERAGASEKDSLETYCRRMARRLLLEEGEIAPPEMDFKRETAWMLRGAGRRSPPDLKITPQEYNTLRQQAFSKSINSATGLLSYDRLKQQYALRLDGEDQQAAAGAGADDTSDEG